MILAALLIAAFWGAAHALTPGHGKALVAGYLVGTMGTPRHAVLLGETVTITHTGRVSLEGRVVRSLPAVSALVILCGGVAITVRALPGVM